MAHREGIDLNHHGGEKWAGETFGRHKWGGRPAPGGSEYSVVGGPRGRGKRAGSSPDGAASYTLAAAWVPPGRNPATRRYHCGPFLFGPDSPLPLAGVRTGAKLMAAYHLKQSNVSKSALASLDSLVNIATPQIRQCRMDCGREAIASQSSGSRP